MASRRSAARRFNERGSALGIVLMSALMAGIAAYAMLGIAVSQANRTRFMQDRTQAKYLAEAGAVFTMQRLIDDPTYCGSTETIAGVPVNITITPSTCLATESKTITVTSAFSTP